MGWGRVGDRLGTGWGRVGMVQLVAWRRGSRRRTGEIGKGRVDSVVKRASVNGLFLGGCLASGSVSWGGHREVRMCCESLLGVTQSGGCFSSSAPSGILEASSTWPSTRIRFVSRNLERECMGQLNSEEE